MASGRPVWRRGPLTRVGHRQVVGGAEDEQQHEDDQDAPGRVNYVGEVVGGRR